jgi:cytochrome c oxidase subunit 2
MLNRLLGIVPNASEHGAAVEHMLEFCHVFMLLLFLGWGTFFFVSLFRYRATRSPRADYKGISGHASTHAEVVVIAIEACLLLGFAVPLWGKRVSEMPRGSDVVRVKAIGEQYAWTFIYAGADGVFGRRDPSFVASDNVLGLDPADPAGRDDVFNRNELHLVNYQPCVVEVTSKDVIHAISIPHMRIAQDAIPGTRIPMWFRPVRDGKYEIVCAQLCGAGHYAMKSQLIVEDKASFDGFLKELAETQHPKSK